MLGTWQGFFWLVCGALLQVQAFFPPAGGRVTRAATQGRLPPTTTPPRPRPEDVALPEVAALATAVANVGLPRTTAPPRPLPNDVTHLDEAGGARAVVEAGQLRTRTAVQPLADDAAGPDDAGVHFPIVHESPVFLEMTDM